MRIHLIGGPGTGKSYISKKLSQKYNLHIIDLDNIEWKDNYNDKNPINKRISKLKRELEQDNIIIEGVYFEWINSSLEKCDYIFYLNVNYYIQIIRIIKRSVFRKLGIYKTTKKESLKSIFSLLRWSKDYNTVLQPKIRKVLEPYVDKIYNVSSYDEIIKILGGRL